MTEISKDSLPFVAWPTVPSLDNDGLKTLLLQLDQSQWWSDEKLRRHQLVQLQLVFEYACRTLPSCRERFEAAGLHPDRLLSLEAWRQLPLLSRQDLQIAGTALRSSQSPSSHGRIAPKVTGGSTAQPVTTLSTELTALFWRATTIRDHLWHERDFSRKLAIIRYLTGGAAAPPDGGHLDNWGHATAGFVSTGVCELLSINSTVDEQARWIERHNPSYLLTYPSLVFALASHFHRHGLRLTNLSEIRTFGEVLEPKVRAACRDAFGVSIGDIYSSQEVGYIALQCPENEYYHVQSENLLVEVLDARGQPCSPGEIGKVVVTTLHNFAMPLLRYDIGDFAEVGEPCACGRGLPVLTRILGRQRNMFVLPNGQQRWPAFELDPTAAFAGSLPVSQFQVIQRSLQQIEVKLVAFRPLSAEEEYGLRSHVEHWLGYAFEVTFTYVDAIPRSPTGKFEDFRCEVPSHTGTI